MPGPLAARLEAAAKPHAAEAEIGWYAQHLPAGLGPILEVMCGTGPLLPPLLRRGLHVHGVDPSAAKLAECERRLSAAGVSTPLFRQPVAQLNLPFRYAAAFCAGGSFQQIDDPLAALEALRRTRAHLIDPALFVIELRVPSFATSPPGAPRVEIRSLALPDGTRITARSEATIDRDARRFDVATRYEHRDGTRIDAREDLIEAWTWYGEDEAVELLASAGFIDVRIAPAACAPDDGHAFALIGRAAA